MVFDAVPLGGHAWPTLLANYGVCMSEKTLVPLMLDVPAFDFEENKITIGNLIDLSQAGDDVAEGATGGGAIAVAALDTRESTDYWLDENDLWDSSSGTLRTG